MEITAKSLSKSNSGEFVGSAVLEKPKIPIQGNQSFKRPSFVFF
jgi:hypothetical protein